jgi:hypothetical protein
VNINGEAPRQRRISAPIGHLGTGACSPDLTNMNGSIRIEKE